MGRGGKGKMTEGKRDKNVGGRGGKMKEGGGCPTNKNRPSAPKCHAR